MSGARAITASAVLAFSLPAVAADAASATSAFSAPESAPHVGGYGFASYGRATVDASQADFNRILGSAGLSNVSSSIDKNSAGFKLGAGYMFDENFGLEGGWIDLGKAKISGRGTAGGSPVTVDLEAQASGPFIAGVLAFPVSNELSVFAKLGFIDSTVEVRATAASIGAVAGRSVSSSELTTMYGAGVRYDVNRQWGIRAEYESFPKLGDKNKTGQADVGLVSVGVVFRFE